MKIIPIALAFILVLSTIAIAVPQDSPLDDRDSGERKVGGEQPRQIDPFPNPTIPTTTSSSKTTSTVEHRTHGSALITSWGFDGEKCVKKDLLTVPRFVNSFSVHNFNKKMGKQILISNTQKGKWIVRRLPGEMAVALMDNKLQLEPTCDKSKVDTVQWITWWNQRQQVKELEQSWNSMFFG